MPEFKQKVSFEDVQSEAETASALLCWINGAPHWIPKSQIDDDSEVFSIHQEGTLVVSEWIAKEKGLV